MTSGVRHMIPTISLTLPVALLVTGCTFFALPQSPYSADEVAPVAFEPASFWYQPISPSATVDPNSDSYIVEMADRYGDRLVLVAREGSVTVFYGDADTARRSIPLSGGIWHGDRRVAGLTNVPLPDYVVPDSADDGHMVLVDTEAGVHIGLWQARMVAGRWIASVGAVISLDTDGVHHGDTVRASGFALAAGIIWPIEIREGGSIAHALVLGYAHTRRNAYVVPASWSDGWSEETFALPVGAHLRLDPSLDLDDAALDLTAYEKKIALAMQTYGMYIHDTNSVGSILELEAVNPLSFASDPYSAIEGFQEAGYERNGSVTLNPNLVEHFQVLTLPEIRDADAVDQTVGPTEPAYFYYRD